MNSLKATLSGSDSPNKQNKQINGSLLKGINKSKTTSLWALDAEVDEAVTQQQLKTDNLMRILNEKIQAAYQRDSTSLSQISFERIIEQFQDQAGGTKSQLSYLLCIEDKLSDILEFSKNDYKKYLTYFRQALTNKITKLKKREKKTELSNFQKIVRGDFKKKAKTAQFLTVQFQTDEKVNNRKDKLASKSPRRQESSQNKLKRLFSKQKTTLKQREKGSFARDTAKQEGEIQNATYCGERKDQSVSFSTVLATSVAVKSRKRKQSINESKKMPKTKKNENQDDEKQQGEEAFIFYRPKKGRK